MVLTERELLDNYYFACAFMAGPPYSYLRRDFSCRDDGRTAEPSPYIDVWTVEGVSRPTNEAMMSSLTMFNITTVRDSITQ